MTIDSSNLIEAISTKRLGCNDVEADVIGRAYEYLIRKFAESSGKSAGEFYTPPEVGMIMARIMDPQPGMEIHDPCCGSAGLLIKCELVLDEHMGAAGKYEPLKLFGQEYTADTWAMANMNMIIHDMEGQIELGDTFNHPKFRSQQGLKTFDRVLANPMWNQDWFTEKEYDNDEFNRFPAGFPGRVRPTGAGCSTYWPVSRTAAVPLSSSIREQPHAAPGARVRTRSGISENGLSKTT